MTVSATLSKTITGSSLSDLLTGGSNGYDWLESEAGDADPPQYPLFFRHDGTQFVSNAAVNVQAMSGTYGGDYSANADLSKLIAHGDAGYGCQVDFRWDGSPLFGVYTAFTSGVGDTFANRIQLPVASMSRNNSGTEVDASAPVAGEVGPTGNAALGDRSHMTFRYVTPSSETLVGKRQFDLYFTFNFTS